MGLLIILILLWLVAPIVLTILYIVALTDNSSLKRKIYTLDEEIKRLRAKLSETNPVDEKPVTETVSAPQAESKPASAPAYQYGDFYKKPDNEQAVGKQDVPKPAPEKIFKDEPKPAAVIPE